MKLVHKALSAVMRFGSRGPEVLVFQHPNAGVQLPKGTVEAGEDIDAATRRELYEESGLNVSCVPELIGSWDRIVGGGPQEDGPLEVNRWWISILRVEEQLPDQWDQVAEGSLKEEGLIFSFFWLPVDAQLSCHLDPLFSDAATMIVNYVERPGDAA